MFKLERRLCIIAAGQEISNKLGNDDVQIDQNYPIHQPSNMISEGFKG